MKFTKEQAFEHLKGLLTENGKTPLHMSERSINEQLDTLMPLIADDEMELNAFVEKVTPTFKTMNSNAKNDQTVFVNDWRQKHPEQQPPAPKPNPNESEEMKQMREKVEALEKAEKKRQDAATISDKRSSILSKLKEKGIKDEEWCKGMLEQIFIDKDTDVDNKVTDLVTFYNKYKASIRSVYTPKGGPSSSEEGKGEFEDVKQARKKQLGIEDEQK